LLSLIHLLCPSANLKSEALADAAISRISDPVSTIGRFAPYFAIIHSHPFLFPLPLRHLFVQLTTFDVPAALSILAHRARAGRIERPRLPVTISREALFDDGLLLLSRVGATALALDIRFAGEPSVGVGPTHEFFTLLSEEFCRTAHGLWRSDSDAEFAFCTRGLFPRPDASPALLSAAGTLCAKAFAMEAVCSFDFNPAFFAIARGRQISLADVDPVLERSLADPAALVGLPFAYPGIPELEIGTGEVSEENAAEFIATVREHTIGAPARRAAAAFCEGFGRVIPWAAMDVFSCEELRGLFRGNAGGFTREELRKNLEAAHGYTDGAPQLEMLIDALLEFDDDDRRRFLRFVTGAGTLPIGGIAALRPRLTVAMRVSESGAPPDATLPSVMTCTNYLKLPEYSCKEILMERLRYAISECEMGFALT
jgi:E3 ubiquitin-protein ligase TRIP12